MAANTYFLEGDGCEACVGIAGGAVAQAVELDCTFLLGDAHSLLCASHEGSGDVLPVADQAVVHEVGGGPRGGKAPTLFGADQDDTEATVPEVGKQSTPWGDSPAMVTAAMPGETFSDEDGFHG